MNQAKIMRITSVLLLAAAAATGSYVVYRAQRTEPVLVAKHNIPPYSFVTPADFEVKYIPAAAVFSDAARSAGQVSGHMTTLGILAGSQIRAGMFSEAHSLQGMVNTISGPGQVTFSLPYKPGSLDSYVAPDTYVDLVAPGPNGATLHAEHVHVLSNTGYTEAPTTGGGHNNQNENPMLILTMPQSQYLAMEQAIAGANVQVLMVSQTQNQNVYQADSGLSPARTSTGAAGSGNAPGGAVFSSSTSDTPASSATGTAGQTTPTATGNSNVQESEQH
ncbi:SAF domain-containing protein [Alicyclobacillus macrosporangiidus]|uniref:SAF domain-containing protein n=1 Tax=Alicyclobacillus macrosporangiidus TaxID=392015 RepID=A0A1I7LB96_9BACL|nr:SAF domain-containing protein [Alicyclobacillus macrosporangiidus]SFV07022.1 SAF domain-containing protein [Alicyclobacillus macrosporangiidus]